MRVYRWWRHCDGSKFLRAGGQREGVVRLAGTRFEQNSHAHDFPGSGWAEFCSISHHKCAQAFRAQGNAMHGHIQSAGVTLEEFQEAERDLRWNCLGFAQKNVKVLTESTLAKYPGFCCPSFRRTGWHGGSSLLAGGGLRGEGGERGEAFRVGHVMRRLILLDGL